MNSVDLKLNHEFLACDCYYIPAHLLLLHACRIAQSFSNKPSRKLRCAHDTRRLGVKSSALWDLVRGAAREVAESRVQITSLVSNFAHESCNDSGFAASASSTRAAVRRTPDCFTAHISKLVKQKPCVLYAISFSVVSGATSAFELSRADIFFTISSSREFRETCGCGPRNATMQQFSACSAVGSLFDESRLLFETP